MEHAIEGDSRRSATAAYALSAGFGALSGMRSMAGPAAVTVAGAVGSSRVLGSAPVVVGALVLAAGEMAADKHPCIPHRTDPASMTARVTMGAVAGAHAARRAGRRGVVGAVLGAVVGSVAAAAFTGIGHALRERLQARLPDHPVAAGLVEDGLVLLAAGALVGASTRSGRAARHRRERAAPERFEAPPLPAPELA